jgi:acid phosphatase family membrane protein YuiD
MNQIVQKLKSTWTVAAVAACAAAAVVGVKIIRARKCRMAESSQFNAKGEPAKHPM